MVHHTWTPLVPLHSQSQVSTKLVNLGPTIFVFSIIYSLSVNAFTLPLKWMNYKTVKTRTNMLSKYYKYYFKRALIAIQKAWSFVSMSHDIMSHSPEYPCKCKGHWFKHCYWPNPQWPLIVEPTPWSHPIETCTDLLTKFGFISFTRDQLDNVHPLNPAWFHNRLVLFVCLPQIVPCVKLCGHLFSWFCFIRGFTLRPFYFNI